MANNKKGDKWRFEGFAFPTTTPVPDQLFDELLYHLSATEIVVLLYIIRRTFGFKKNRDNISLKQLCEGIITNDGKVLDWGTGLSKATVARALNSLEEKNVIKRIRRRSRKKGDEPTTYELNFLTPVSQFETPRVSSARHPVSHPRDTQQTVKQQTDLVIVDGLTERGITKKVARELAIQYPKEYLIEKMDLLDYLVKSESPLVSRNPAGYLRKAITDDYTPPRGFKTRAERSVELERQEEQQEHLAEMETQERERDKALRSQLAESYQDLEPEATVWQLALQELRLSFDKAFFNTWLRDADLDGVKDGMAIILVGNDVAAKTLQEHASEEVQEVLGKLFGKPTRVRFETYGYGS